MTLLTAFLATKLIQKKRVKNGPRSFTIHARNSGVRNQKNGNAASQWSRSRHIKIQFLSPSPPPRPETGHHWPNTITNIPFPDSDARRQSGTLSTPARSAHQEPSPHQGSATTPPPRQHHTTPHQHIAACCQVEHKSKNPYLVLLAERQQNNNHHCGWAHQSLSAASARLSKER